MTKLQERRAAAGLSRPALAKAAGVNVRTIESYEQGLRKVRRMALEDALKIAAALNCSVEELIDNNLM